MDQECVVQRLHQFLCHIKHLKIVLEGSREANRKHMTQILDMLIWQNNEVRALSMVCQGRRPPYFFSDQDLQWSFSSLRGLRYLDLRQTSFTLGDETVLLIAACSPDLRALLINSRLSPFYILRAETIAEVLRMCPQLSALGVQHATLSEEVFQELLKPSRGPFHFLDIFCEGLNDDIPEALWSALIEKHPQLCVGLVFCFTVPYANISATLKPNIPVTALQFKYSYRLVGLIQLVTNHYSRTLERLDLNTSPSDDLNMSLMELARNCVRLKEIHCSCTVSQAVEEAFLLYCPGLIKYTLKT
ncbi:F-box/LRR-repeat protein 8-like isoform X2 [Hemicordylus capensis]|nr:F-box/LRR-repeat protein 8-like isoform X2 [Hemicordylus capensis]